MAFRPSGCRMASRNSGEIPVTDITNAFLVVYAALFPIVNPLGSAPVFLSLTRQLFGGGTP